MSAFVSLPFEEIFDSVFETVSKVVMLRGLDAIRAERAVDQTAPSALAAVERHIRSSQVIIADLTGHHANVLQDIRYATRLGKPRILISQEAPERATMQSNGLTIYPYDLEDLDSLRNVLVELAIDFGHIEQNAFAETMFHGTLSAQIGLRHLLPGHWQNPFGNS